VSGTIFQNCLKAMALSRPLLSPYAEDYSRNAVDLAQIIKAMPAGELQTEVKQAYADALKVVWGVMCFVSAVGLAVTFFTKEYSLDNPQRTGDLSKEDNSSKEIQNC
jgi:hypothetical protein